MAPKMETKQDGCRLFSMVQYQCSPEGGQVTCWPLERVFRQCGKGPAIEVTNSVIRDKKGNITGVAEAFIENPPKGKLFADIR